MKLVLQIELVPACQTPFSFSIRKKLKLNFVSRYPIIRFHRLVVFNYLTRRMSLI